MSEAREHLVHCSDTLIRLQSSCIKPRVLNVFHLTASRGTITHVCFAQIVPLNELSVLRAWHCANRYLYSLKNESVDGLLFF